MRDTLAGTKVPPASPPKLRVIDKYGPRAAKGGIYKPVVKSPKPPTPNQQVHL